MKHNTNFWLEEEDNLQLPTTQAQQQNQQPQDSQEPQVPQDSQGEMQGDPEEPKNDPFSGGGDLQPDMPEEKEDNLDNFETWKLDYFKQSITSDVNDLIETIQKIRDEELDSYQRKFVEDNLQVLFLRQNSNIDKANKELRKMIRNELDENNPSVSLINHLDVILKKYPELANILIKIKGTLGMKGDLHRKFLASLFGCVQVGNGGENEDIILNENSYSIKASTRFNEKWGKVELGRWFLKSSDPERFLEEAELKRMQEGSPEEREVLRKRVVIDSISEYYKERSFLINTVSSDGTIYSLGIDLNSCLSSSYNEGKLVVRLINSENNECSFDSDGNISNYVNIKICFAMDADTLDENGFPKKEELEFIEKVNGSLFLSASLDTIKKIYSDMNGVIFKEIPYNGNPSDLFKIQRCVPSANEILMRSC